MKIKLKVDVVISDDEGNIIVEEQSEMKVSNVTALIKTVINTAKAVVELVADEESAEEAKSAFAEAMKNIKPEIVN